MHKLTTFENGLRVLVDEDKNVETVSVNFLLLAGGKDEDDSNRGIAHLAEHMFFKGSKKRSGKDIVLEFDKSGIRNNAFTSQDSTCFFADAQKDDCEKVFDILSDCFFNPTYPEKELQTEKQAVCSEQEMYIDDDKDYVTTVASELALAGTPYSYVLGGKVEEVKRITQADLIKFHNRFYTPDRLIISVSGNVTEEKVLALVNKYVMSQCSREKKTPVSYSVPNYKLNKTKKQSFVSRETDQYYCCIGFKPFSECDADQLKFRAMITCLGGPMSSRLFQNVRYERGLVYVIHSFYYHENFSLNGIIFYTNTEKSRETVEVVASTLESIRQKGFTDEEVKIAKNVLRTSYALGTQTPHDKAMKAAFRLVYADKIFDLKEVLSDIDKITKDDVNEMFNKYYKTEDMIVSIVSNKEMFDAYDILTGGKKAEKTK